MKRFTDEYSESRKWVPPPNTYKVPDFTKPIQSTKTFQIYKSERKTLEEVKIVTKRNVPPPGTYNPEPVRPRVIGPIKSTTEKSLFVGEAEYRGLETSSPG